MIDWLTGLIPHFKALHIVLLVVWCSGLFALPLMLSRHDSNIEQSEYARIRVMTHYTYTYLVTPAAVLAIATGTVLIFLREVFVLWMFAKLVVVAMLVIFHAWVGYVLVWLAETQGEHIPPSPRLPFALLVLIVIGILTLVLVKPELREIPIPTWLSEPRGYELPFDVPRR